MKTLRMILCLMLTAALLTGAALAEAYTDDWGNGITLNFEIDDSLLQPLDIFDTSYYLPPQNPTNEQISAAKDSLQKALEMTLDGDIPEIHENIGSPDSTASLYASCKVGDNDVSFSLNFFQFSCFDLVQEENYKGTYLIIDDDFSRFSSFQSYLIDFPATRNDFYVEHDYMTHEEADTMLKTLLSTLRGKDSPFDVVLRDWYGITHEQIADVVHWISTHDDFYDHVYKSDFDDWTNDYDSYYLLYSYTYKGYPVCDWVQTSYSGNIDSPIYPCGYDTTALINRSGFVKVDEFMLFDCDYAPYEDTPALTLYEALDVLKSYLGGIKGLNPIEINRVYVEYLPYFTEDDLSYKRTFEPIWSFVTDMTTKYGRMENYMVYRVNARTGAIMTNGTGVIE